MRNKHRRRLVIDYTTADAMGCVAASMQTTKYVWSAAGLHDCTPLCVLTNIIVNTGATSYCGVAALRLCFALVCDVCKCGDVGPGGLWRLGVWILGKSKCKYFAAAVFGSQMVL